jgi:hypothetical protein
MSELKCKNCGRPVRVDRIPEFCGEMGYNAVYHDDGGDALFCYDDERTEEAALEAA